MVSLSYADDERENERHRVDFERLWPYARDLYQRPAFRETIEGLPAAWDSPHGRGR
ncbi:hypothetical protein [Nonomuraea jabiensis]|uniref:hypothetical protein n=1 Tax=Nonomuraea jabiensis TaxID=882448 RepID=UPI0036829549